MTSRPTRLRDRPLTDRERRGALAAVTVVLAAAAVLLAISGPAASHHHTTRRSPHIGRAVRRPIHIAHATVLAAQAESVARRFASGYLAYLYGHAPASQIRDATPTLLRSLDVHPALASPDVRARQPRIISLEAARASAGVMTVSVLVNDGELADYTVELELTSSSGRLLVAGDRQLT